MSTTNNNSKNNDHHHHCSNTNIGMILRNEMENIRRSITCPICLSTMKDPITLSGCSHTFCASCIQQSLTTSTNTRRTKSSPYVCPLCHVAFTRRSIQTNSRTNITTLIQHYKRLTQSFGIAPIQYTPSIHTCTQMEEVDSFQNQSSDDSEADDDESNGTVNSNDSDDDDSMEDDEDDSVRLDPSGKRRPSSSSIELSRYPTSLQDIADQYHVSQYMYQALVQQPPPTHRGETTVPPSTTSSLLQQEQAQIVQANQSYYFQKRRNRQKQMKKHPSKPLLKSIPHRNRLDRSLETTSKATMCPPSATTTPTSQSKVSFTIDTVAPSHSTKTNPARESVPTILRSPIPSSFPPRDQSSCTASLTKRKASHKKTAPEEEEVGASTPSWTQIVQAAQSQEVANHNLSDDDEDESTHDHFYSALDQIPVSQKSVSQRHDRIVYTTTAATIPEEQNDMWNVDHNNRSAPRCCDQIQDRVEFDMYHNDDDDDSLPDASNIPPPRRNSVVVAEILQQQDSIESVSSETSNNPNDDDDDINLSDTKHPALSIPPLKSSDDASKVVPNMNAVTKRRNETAANILLSVPINVTATAAICRIGDIVQVQPRTGPGMNRLGGIAEIVKVHTSHDEGSDKATTTVSYDVRYVLNRRQREHRLEACYISKAQDYANTSTMVTTTTIQSNTSVTKRYVQRRSCPNPISVLPSPLRAALLADGCDVDGIATRKALAQYNNKSSIGSGKENSVHQNEIPRGGAKTKKAAVQKSNSKRKALLAKTSTTNTVPTKPRQPPTKRIKQSQMRGTVSAGNVDDLPTWTNAVKCQLADERYRSKITAALQKGVIYISTSLLSIVEQEQLQQLCRVVHKNIKVKITDTIEPKRTTICLLPTVTPPSSTTTAFDNVMADRRSMKAMWACVDGIPIVSASWIGHCLQRKSVTVPEENMFVRTLPTKTLIGSISEFGVAYQAALIGYASASSLPLRQVNVACMVGFDSTSNDINNFSSLLRRAGVNEVVLNPSVALTRLKEFVAQEETSVNIATNSKSIEYFVVVCNDEANSAKTKSFLPDAFLRAIHNFTSPPTSKSVVSSRRLIVVNLQWLFDSVTCGVLLHADTKSTMNGNTAELDTHGDVYCYRPKDERASGLWQITK